MSHLPDAPDPRFDAVAAALQDGDAERALSLARRGAKQARREGDDALAADLHWLEGAALLDLGEAPAALAALDEALRLVPDHLDALLERAEALFELCRFDEAGSVATSVLELADDEARAHHLLGLLAERRGDDREAERRLARARKLDPEGFPRPVRLSRRDFDAAVERAFEALPEPVRRYLSNVPVTVEDLPADHDLLDVRPAAAAHHPRALPRRPVRAEALLRPVEPPPLLHRPLPAQPGAGRREPRRAGGGDRHHPGPRGGPLPRPRRGRALGPRPGLSGVPIARDQPKN